MEVARRYQMQLEVKTTSAYVADLLPWKSSVRRDASKTRRHWDGKRALAATGLVGLRARRAIGVQALAEGKQQEVPGTFREYQHTFC